MILKLKKKTCVLGKKNKTKPRRNSATSGNIWNIDEGSEIHI